MCGKLVPWDPFTIWIENKKSNKAFEENLPFWKLFGVFFCHNFSKAQVKKILCELHALVGTPLSPVDGAAAVMTSSSADILAVTWPTGPERDFIKAPMGLLDKLRGWPTEDKRSWPEVTVEEAELDADPKEDPVDPKEPMGHLCIGLVGSAGTGICLWLLTSLVLWGSQAHISRPWGLLWGRFRGTWEVAGLCNLFPSRISWASISLRLLSWEAKGLPWLSVEARREGWWLLGGSESCDASRDPWCSRNLSRGCGDCGSWWCWVELVGQSSLLKLELCLRNFLCGL